MFYPALFQGLEEKNAEMELVASTRGCHSYAIMQQKVSGLVERRYGNLRLLLLTIKSSYLFQC